MAVLNTDKKLLNNNKQLRSFKRKENIQKKEAGPYHGSMVKPDKSISMAAKRFNE